MLYWSWQPSPHIPEKQFNRDVLRRLLPQCCKLLLSLWPVQGQVSDSKWGWGGGGGVDGGAVSALSKPPCGDNRYIWPRWIPPKDLFPVTTLEICVVAFWIFQFWSCFQSDPVTFERSAIPTECLLSLLKKKKATHTSIQFIIYLCLNPLSQAFCPMWKKWLQTRAQHSCVNKSIAACIHPSLTYLMAGFWWRPAAQIEKFSVTKWNVWLSLQSRRNSGLFTFNSKPNFR